MDHFNESERNLQTVSFVKKLYGVVEQLEAGHHVSDKVLRALLDEMEEKADGVGADFTITPHSASLRMGS